MEGTALPSIGQAICRQPIRGSQVREAADSCRSSQVEIEASGPVIAQQVARRSGQIGVLYFLLGSGRLWGAPAGRRAEEKVVESGPREVRSGFRRSGVLTR
jgi:hypothetical protein